MKNVKLLKKEKLKVKKLLLLIGIFFLFSCKKEDNDVVKIIPIKKSFSKTYFNFPDTVFKNKIYNGKIYYSSLFDTLGLKMDKDRFVSFYVNSDNKKLTLKQLFKEEHDTFYIKKDTIYFDISFKKKGNNFINGFISDDVYIEKKDSIRNIEKIIDFIIPVYVK
jgi:hypothetical protein